MTLRDGHGTHRPEALLLWKSHQDLPSGQALRELSETLPLLGEREERRMRTLPLGPILQLMFDCLDTGREQLLYQRTGRLAIRADGQDGRGSSPLNRM